MMKVGNDFPYASGRCFSLNLVQNRVNEVTLVIKLKVKKEKCKMVPDCSIFINVQHLQF